MQSTSSKPKNRLYSALLSGSLLALSLVPAVMAACSSSEEASPNRPITPAPVGSTGSSSGSSGAADAAPEADPSCTTAAGCFSCEPTTLTEFYNACTEGQCAPFDNARLPLYEPGKPLPPVP